MFEDGLFEDDPEPSAIAVEEHGETAREVAETGITLLKNSQRRAAAQRPPARVDRGDRRRREPGSRPGRRVARHADLRGLAPRRDARPRAGAAWTSSTRPAPTRSARPRCCSGPAGRAVVDLRLAGRSATRPAGHVLRLDRSLRRADRRRAPSPGVRFDQGFIGGSAGVLEPVRLAAARPRRGAPARRATRGTFTAPRTGSYTFALTGWGEAQMFLDGDARHRPRHRGRATWPRSAPATLNLRAGEEHEVTIEYRATRAVHRASSRARCSSGGRIRPTRYSPDIQDAVELGARRRCGGRVRHHVRERAARPRLADAAQRPGPADPRRVRRQPEHRRGARRRGAGDDAVAAPGRRGRRLLLRRPGAGQRDRRACSSATSTRRASCRSPSRAARASPRSSGSRTPGTRSTTSTVEFDEGIFVGLPRL